MIKIINDLSVYSPFIVSIFAFISLNFKNKRKDKAIRILGYFMFAGTLFFGINILRIQDSKDLFHYFYVFYISLSLVSFPLAFMYFRSLTIFKESDKKVITHFIPALLLMFVGNILYFSLDYNERIAFLDSSSVQNLFIPDDYKLLGLFFLFFKVIYLLQSFFYSTRIYIILKEHNNALNHFFSDSSGYKLNWVKSILWVCITWSCLAAAGHFFMMQKFESPSNLRYIIDISISILFAGLYLLGSDQKSIPDVKAFEITIDENASNHNLKQKLLKVFEEKHAYLNKELTIWDLCREVNSNRTYLSNLINNEFGLNFNSFVNKYRVEKAKLMLVDKAHSKYSLSGIGELSGFNSIASFNRAFQKFEKSSPGAYKKQAIQNKNNSTGDFL